VEGEFNRFILSYSKTSLKMIPHRNKSQSFINQSTSNFTSDEVTTSPLEEVVLKGEKKQQQEMQCEHCGKFFSRADSLKRHQKTTSCLGGNQSRRKIVCGGCGIFFSRVDILKRHRNEGRCPKQVGRGDEKLQGKCGLKNIHCHQCANVCQSKTELYKHYMLQHRQLGGQLQNTPWGREENSPWNQEKKVDHELRDVYNMHVSLILQNHNIGNLVSTYNFPVDNSLNIEQMMEQLEYIYSQESKVFKINLAFGFILKNIETNKYRFFKPYTNSSVFEIPISISKRKDLEEMKEKMISIDILEFVSNQREHSKYKFFMLTNILYSVYSQLEFALGKKETLPMYIKQPKSIISLDKDYKGNVYQDNLCFFRCLSYHLHRELYKSSSRFRLQFEQRVEKYFQEYLKYIEKENILVKKPFQGIDLSIIPEVEICFSININIFKLHEDGTCSAVYKSLLQFGETLNLNLYENHLSYITDFQQYAKKFQCRFCSKVLYKKYHYERHETNCETKQTLHFVGGFHKQKATIFEELDYFGIHVDEEKRFFKEFIVFDMESILKPLKNKRSEKIVWTHEHCPVSVSICSNHEEFKKPYCIINPDIDVLVKDMVTYMMTITLAIQRDKVEAFEEYFEALDDLIYEWECENGDESFSLGQKMMLNKLNSLKEALEKYCSETPVLGFNSGRYDINLIKGRVLEYMQMEKCKNKFVVKRNNSYSCISNGDMKILDVTNFLSPGISYAQFLKAFDVVERKGFFPYEYFTDVSKLKEKHLPPLGPAWWSSLKRKCLLDDGIHSIKENYQWLQRVWVEEGMTSFQDFLRWYNNLDVYPFIEALTRLSAFYFKKGIDIFKESISLPGISRKMIFNAAREENDYFALIDKKNEDLYHIINDNIVGGPSIIFNRFHKKNETFIRNNNEFPCKKICGWDANALYLWAIGQKMPAGDFVRRKRENGFYPEKRQKYESMFHWMDWLNYSQSKNILHYRNSAREKRVGPFLVDGFDPGQNALFQFQGCYFHGHQCRLTRHIKNKKDQRDLFSRQKRTKLITSYLKSKGYKVFEIYECEFMKMKRGNWNLRNFINKYSSPFTRGKNRKVNEEEILEGILSEKLYGMVEVDISVPASWGEVKFRPDTHLDPYDYYSEMSPLFGNVEVPFDVIGETMQDYVKRNNLGMKPRRLLIGAMKAEKMLIATPLLKWYILHGLKVSRIYQVIEYNNPTFSFRNFVKEVTEARRLGDQDSTKSVIADTMKLIGNAAFGSMIMNKAKFKTISYVKGLQEGSKIINDRLFERISEIGEEYYEVELYKKKIDLDLPTQIGFFILQYAKLRMLEFYYDFMDKYVDRRHFEYCQMDTDSAYIAIAGDSLDDVIKPSMWQEYLIALEGQCNDTLKMGKQWFPRRCCQHHIQFDKRTPGLFKVEFQGDQMISLCSKTYVISSGEKYKLSSKGVNKCNIKNPLEIYREVLKMGESGSGENIGFRLHENKIYTYNQEKAAFSYLYCKRKLLEDGVSTEPLDITLTPSKKKR
jgi:G:T-mismatch repair DNA endonuclease (very short patch repair protein)